MHDLLLNTLTAKTAQLSPSVLDIVNRTRTLGLHKVAAHTHNCVEYGLQDVIRELGTKLAYAHLKHQKIASGLESLRELHQDQTVKLSLFRHSGTAVSSLLTAAKQAPLPLKGNLSAARSGIGSLPPPPPGVQAAERLPMGRLPNGA